MTWYEKVVAAHTAVTDAVSHGKRLQSERYFVWNETNRDDFGADNRHAEKCQRGTTHLFTKIELDPWKDAFERSLDQYGIVWSLNWSEFEEDTGFWHFEWRWGVRYA